MLHRPIPTHILSGFLGAGKTTLLQQLLKQKPEGETWAILMNEFGQIGVDQLLVPNQDGYAVKELLGGCLCCSSQLPMQIALSRLIQSHRPDRLFIEPTGLGHPAQLLEQLNEPHWQTTLAMRALVSVVDGTRVGDVDWSNEPLYQAQLQAAQVVVVSHADVMNASDDARVEELKTSFAAYDQTWYRVENGQIDLAALDVPHQFKTRHIQPLLMQQQTQSFNHNEARADERAQEVKRLPYHYVEYAQGYSVAGWKFPAAWQFEFDGVLDLLCAQQDWQRIKAIFYTTQGWMQFNFTPQQFQYKQIEPQVDQRIEIIVTGQREWLSFEQDLLQLKLS